MGGENFSRKPGTESSASKKKVVTISNPILMERKREKKASSQDRVGNVIRMGAQN